MGKSEITEMRFQCCAVISLIVASCCAASQIPQIRCPASCLQEMQGICGGQKGDLGSCSTCLVENEPHLGGKPSNCPIDPAGAKACFEEFCNNTLVTPVIMQKPPPVCKECAVPDAAICMTLTDPHQCEILALQCPCACICCQQGQVPPTWCHQTGASSHNTGASSRNTGASSRNTGASSRNTGASSRNTGASSRNTGASSPFSFAVNLTSDPSNSWLSYAFFDSGGKVITQMNATVTVPAAPKRPNGDSDPSFWYGLQTDAGDGALVQPILAWNQRDSGFGVFHEVFDWSEGRDHQSPDHFAVQPGDVLTQSVTYKTSDNSYDMLIFSKELQKSVLWNYKLSALQKAQETTAYIVVEHQPSNCNEYPASGGITFSDIYIEVEGKPVENPTFVAKQQKTACNSKAVIVDAKTVDLKWTV